MKHIWVLVSGLAIMGPVFPSDFSLGVASEYRYEGQDHLVTVDAVAIGDVTGDGRKDLVATTSWNDDPLNDYRLLIYAQRPDGTFAPPLKLPYGTSQSFPDMGIGSLAIADLDKDGIEDIVVAHHQGISQLLARGNGAFRRTEIPYDPIQRILLVDVDKNGILDFVVWSNGIQVMYRSSNGIVSTKAIAPHPDVFWEDVKVDDVTGDGLPDLLITAVTSLWVSAQTPSHTFMAAVEYKEPRWNTGGWHYGSIAVADFNSDGRKDVVVALEANLPDQALLLHTQGADGRLDGPYYVETAEQPKVYPPADLDHDGRSDLIVDHGPLGIYFQGATGLSAEKFTEGVYGGEGGFKTGDLNGDGCTDLATTWSFVYVRPGSNCHEPWSMANRHDGDFDGDGRADILWHDAATGASVIWKSGDSATRITMTRVTNTDWTIAGAGDFDGDGKSDVLWHNVASGANVVWFAADSRRSQSLQQVTDLGWTIVGIGDFDGNGRDDILWHQQYTGANAIWNEGLYAKGRTLSTVTDRDWLVVGVGDFDGNGRDDILWRHRDDGRNAIWRNADAASLQTVSTVPDLGWQVAGIGDFDHDGRSDILWHHAYDGQNAIWHAASYASSRFLTRITELRWKIAGVGDYDHDGRADILWRHSGTGAATIWRDAESTTLRPVTGVTNMNWKIVR